jgi:hypothetical protein
MGRKIGSETCVAYETDRILDGLCRDLNDEVSCDGVWKKQEDW